MDTLQKEFEKNNKVDVLKRTHQDMIMLMEDAIRMLEGKAADYGTNNFEQAAAVARVITGTQINAVTVAACLIGIKCARYGNLLSKAGGHPVNEAITDTVADLSNYVYLMERERQRMA